MEPKLTPEEQAEQDAEDAARAQARKEREWATWGESPEQLAAQERFMAMAGPEG